MKLIIPHRISALIIATTIGGGAAATAFSLTASADTGHRSDATCPKAHGKYAPRLLAHYTITGGDDSAHGLRGGTLQVWASDSCKTIWVKTVKLNKYSKQPYLTVAAISFWDKPHNKVTQRVEKTTRSSVETPAVPNPSTRTASFRIEGGFVGPYQFDSAHTYRY